MNPQGPTTLPNTASIRFESGLLVAQSKPTDCPKLWTFDSRTGGDGRWVTNAMNSRKLAHPLPDNQARWSEISFQKTNLNDLRADQREACEVWSRTKSGVIVMPTGTGKTEVALHLVRQIAAHTLFIAPTRALAYQLAGRIENAFGADVGFIGDQTFRLRPLCVATYQSAGVKMEFLGDYFKFIVFDECHHLTGNLRQDAALMSAAPYRLGLTATPQIEAANRPAFEELIGPICYKASIESARGSILAPYQIRRIPVYLTDAEQERYEALGNVIRDHFHDRRKRIPGYDWKHVTLAIGNDPGARHAFYARLKRCSIEENAIAKLEVLEDLFREHDQQVVVFTGSNSMARTICMRFLIPCLLAHTKRKEREFILDGYEKGEFRAIVANRVLNEGIDIPAAKVGIVVGGTGSTREAIQRLGRILRKKGIASAILYEVVCAGTKEEQRSRNRRRNNAYQRRSAV